MSILRQFLNYSKKEFVEGCNYDLGNSLKEHRTIIYKWMANSDKEERNRQFQISRKWNNSPLKAGGIDMMQFGL